MSTPVEQIKSRLSIVDVVGNYVRLTKAGSAYKALCPFHSEKSPSFTVSPTRQAFHCFGCNKGGDIFTFIEEIEGLDFSGALKVLAEKAGVELKKEDRKVTEGRERWYSIMETATRYYLSQMTPGSRAYEYLTGRGLSPETIANFRIGFAPAEPEGWHGLSDALHERNIKDEEIEKVGLSKRAEPKAGEATGRFYDRFRSRVMFPVSDSSGRVIAFSGRIFGVEKDDTAKYINSPETPLYDKSTALFGFDKAKVAIRKQNFAVIVEGQMDLVMSHQAGTENTVAVSGTALTETHLGLLKRLTPNLVFAFDGDKAGVNATARAFSLAQGLDMQVRVAVLPKGKDPADVIREDKSVWEKAILESKAFIPFLLEQVMSESADLLVTTKAVESRVLPYVAQIRSQMEQNVFVQQIARSLGIPDRAVGESLSKVRLASQYAGVGSSTPSAVPVRAPETTSLIHRLQEELIGLVLWQEGEKGKDDGPVISTEEMDTIRSRFTTITGKNLGEGLTEAQSSQAIFRVEQTYDPTKLKHQLFQDLLDRLDIALSEERQASIHQKLARAEQERDKEGIGRHSQEFQDISKHIHRLKEQGQRL